MELVSLEGHHSLFIKPGTMLKRFGPSDRYFTRRKRVAVKKGKWYEFSGTKTLHLIRLSHSGNFGWSINYFQIRKLDLLLQIANYGRESANELLEKYSDYITIENGLYKLKESKL